MSCDARCSMTCVGGAMQAIQHPFGHGWLCQAGGLWAGATSACNTCYGECRRRHRAMCVRVQITCSCPHAHAHAHATPARGSASREQLRMPACSHGPCMTCHVGGAMCTRNAPACREHQLLAIYATRLPVPAGLLFRMLPPPLPPPPRPLHTPSVTWLGVPACDRRPSARVLQPKPCAHLRQD